MIVRRENPADATQVYQIQSAAFGQPAEANLAVALRDGGHAIGALSLVAEIKGTVVGHVVCSRGRIEQEGSPPRPSVGLGPIGVDPDHQRAGVGSALMHTVIGAADALGEPLIALLGSTRYYPRFGFVPSTDLGVIAPDPGWGGHFQVRALANHDSNIKGEFIYASPFDDL